MIPPNMLLREFCEPRPAFKKLLSLKGSLHCGNCGKWKAIDICALNLLSFLVLAL